MIFTNAHLARGNYMSVEACLSFLELRHKNCRCHFVKQIYCYTKSQFSFFAAKLGYQCNCRAKMHEKSKWNLYIDEFIRLKLPMLK